MKTLLLVFTLMVLAGFSAGAQEITGVVTSSVDGEPLPGVSVLVKGTSIGTSTDVNGSYSFTLPEIENPVLIFSFVGYLAEEVVVGNQSTINIALAADIQQLQEIVVTAFGIEREKKALGYSVTEVEGESLTKAREINLGDALQGKVAGVNVSNIGSGVGGSSRVIIRGNTSLSGNNEPLYIIDGVPIDNTQLGAAGVWGGSDWGDGLSSLNPDDIENITVLKGGTAAALYGSRASNGVILITTKKGTKRKGIGVEINSNLTAENYVNNYDFQDEYGHGTNGIKPDSPEQGFEYGNSAWGARLDGSNVYQFDGVQRPYSSTGDNFSKFYRTGYTLTNTVALTGGGENQIFRFSASDLRSDAITPNSGMDRQTFTLTTNSRWMDKLSLDAKIQYSREDVQNRSRLSDSPGNPNYTLVVLPPSINVEDLEGTTGKAGAQADGTEQLYTNNIFTQNPYWAAYQFVNSDTRNRILGAASLRYDFTDWLYAQARIGSDWYSSRRTQITPYGTGYSALGEMRELTRQVYEVNMDYLIGANKDFGDLGVNVFFGGNKMIRKDETLGTEGNTFNIPFLHTIKNLQNQSVIYAPTGDGGIPLYGSEGINSIYGSAEFSYKNMLFLNFSGRNDWFSTLPKESNHIFYPSVGTSFVFTDAFEMPKLFSFGKVRASWAQVGGDTYPYQLALNYGIFGQGHLGAALGRINQSSVPNNQLQPLTVTEYELGLDLRLLDNRLRLDYAYYNRITENDIIQATIAETSGYTNATVNVGEVLNKGHEILLSGTPVKGPLTWDVTLNFSYNKNEVRQLFGDSKVLLVQEARSFNASVQHRIPYTDENGEFFEGGYSSIVGYRHLEIDGQKVYDDNGLPVRDETLRVLGSGVHPYTGGINNEFNFKNFNFGFLIDYKFGGDIYSGTNTSAYAAGMHKATLEGRETGLVVTGVDVNGNPGTWEIAGSDPDNTGAITVADYYGRLSTISEYFVEDADYIKLRQVILGYDLPSSIIEKTPFNAVSLSFVARNLWLIHSKVDNIDPESTYNTSNGQGLEWFGVPQTRSYGFNLNLKF